MVSRTSGVGFWSWGSGFRLGTAGSRVSLGIVFGTSGLGFRGSGFRCLRCLGFRGLGV